MSANDFDDFFGMLPNKLSSKAETIWLANTACDGCEIYPRIGFREFWLSAKCCHPSQMKPCRFLVGLEITQIIDDRMRLIS
jgi:hypothetical protein